MTRPGDTHTCGGATDFAHLPPPSPSTAACEAERAAAITRRVHAQLPASGSETALRRHIFSIQLGHSVHESMTLELQEALRSRPGVQEAIVGLGSVRSIRFRGVGPQAGYDIYEVVTDNGSSEWRLGLNASGATEGLIFRLLETPPARPPTRAQFRAQLRQRLANDSVSDRFSGCVLVGKSDAPIFESAHGMANRERRQPIGIATQFRIASMNKMFTAVAILQLVESGKIHLDAPLGQYLKDYPNRDVATKVTVRQLLTHTGGTGDIFGDEYTTHRRGLHALTDYVNLYGRRGVSFEPGLRFAYSSYGFVLLGLVIERVSDSHYHDYVRGNIFRPTGMSATDSLPEELSVPNLAIGYTHGANGLQSNADTLPPRATSAGGGHSTVRDLFAFARALHTHTLLSPAGTELLTTATVTTGNSHCTHGFFLQECAGAQAFGHDGGAPGMSGALWIIPRLDYVVAVLSNLDPPSAHSIAEFITVRLPKG